MAVISNQFQGMGAKYGVPKSDPGASFGDQTPPAVDTSSIFYGSSKDKATSWRVNRGAGSTPNAAYAGKGAISFDDGQGYQPVEVR